MNNPRRILQAVDARLDHRVELVLYGRAALALGFGDPPPAALATSDVDGIIPADRLAALRADDNWWEALEGANGELEAQGLYLTHLFDEGQVILRPGWRRETVEVPCPGLRFLALRRPATLDLILTKMMRGRDPQDLEDIRFYLEREPALDEARLRRAFAEAVGPDLPELWDAFAAAQPAVLALAQRAGQTRPPGPERAARTPSLQASPPPEPGPERPDLPL